MESTTYKYFIWAKIIFFPFLAIWFAWCYLLGCTIEVRHDSRVWKLK